MCFSTLLLDARGLREDAAALAESKLVSDQSIVIAEHDKRFDPGEGVWEMRRYRKLVQGDAALSFYRRQS